MGRTLYIWYVFLGFLSFFLDGWKSEMLLEDWISCGGVENWDVGIDGQTDRQMIWTCLASCMVFSFLFFLDCGDGRVGDCSGLLEELRRLCCGRTLGWGLTCVGRRMRMPFSMGVSVLPLGCMT